MSRKTLATVAFAALLALCAAQGAAAGTLQQGLDAYRRGEYERSHRLIQPLAREGAPYAQYYLGLLYRNGQGVPADPATAVRWFRRAAEQGLARAQYALGGLYDTGDGVARDDIQAYLWFKLAAGQGVSKAVRNLDIVMRRMTPGQRSAAERLVRTRQARQMRVR